MKTSLALYLSTLGLALAACGDDPKQTPDAGVTPDAPMPDGGTPFTPPTPVAVALSAAGPDQLQSATAAPGGKFYAAGYAAQTLTGARFVTVVKYSATGLDATFGTGGIVTTTVDFKGGADEVDITTQADGKILVSATVASPTNANDRDVAVIRLLDTGALDDTFGEGGIATINLNDGFDNGTTLIGLDAARSITVGASGIFVHAASRGVGNATAGGPRQDTDFTVVKLTATGDVDTTFATAWTSASRPRRRARSGCSTTASCSPAATPTRPASARPSRCCTSSPPRARSMARSRWAACSTTPC
jgi:uncharacterized delta-60 repeat protein